MLRSRLSPLLRHRPLAPSLPQRLLVRSLTSEAATLPKAVTPTSPLWLWTRRALVVATPVALYLGSDNVRRGVDITARCGLAGAVGAIISYHYKVTLSGEDWDDRQKRKAVHQKGADWLLWLFRQNGGIYVKIGQHLAALQYLLPDEYTSTMAVLQNEAPQSSMDAVNKVVLEDWGQPISAFFSSFDSEPLGVASLAQVHHAVLHDGREVAVKVQHRELGRFADSDTVAIEFIVHIVKKLFPEFDFDWLADEIKENLPNEMNFIKEGMNADRVREMFKDNRHLVIPEIYWPFTSRRILTMEFTPGGKISDADYMEAHELPIKEISKELTHIFSEMIFRKGYVHCDPHPGNVFVRPKKGSTKKNDFEIILLDHGLYKELTDSFRMDYAHLWAAILSGNEEKIKEYSGRLGAGDLYKLFTSILTMRVWDSVVTQEAGQTTKIYSARTDKELESIKRSAAGYLVDASKILASVPRQLLLLLKTNDLLRSIDITLQKRASINSFTVMARSCVDAIYEEEDKQKSGVSRWWAWVQYQNQVLRLALANRFYG